ncbi:hypothetical protein POX_c04526 [Penicillium oxalicum]|uniref:hypothetical protein n=1 Tax=Penicillium oxalicum TaxID=69781 RepID=UPI0020B7ED21|nr:hypothetical protein POX_c04526 [Penicillium oxalicum]KAI2791660.1 hypothetical protein POX_c04526 [Penicillium oxalicum]
MKEGLRTSQGRRDYQKMLRRRETLFKKATEYDVQCDADIQLVVRMRKTGQIVILTTNSKGWPLSAEQLESNHPQPIWKTTGEFAGQKGSWDGANTNTSDGSEIIGRTPTGQNYPRQS